MTRISTDFPLTPGDVVAVKAVVDMIAGDSVYLKIGHRSVFVTRDEVVALHKPVLKEGDAVRWNDQQAQIVSRLDAPRSEFLVLENDRGMWVSHEANIWPVRNPADAKGDARD